MLCAGGLSAWCWRLSVGQVQPRETLPAGEALSSLFPQTSPGAGAPPLCSAEGHSLEQCQALSVSDIPHCSCLSAFSNFSNLWIAPSAYWTLQLVGQGWVFPELLVLEVKLMAVTVLLQDKTRQGL